MTKPTESTNNKPTRVARSNRKNKGKGKTQCFDAGIETIEVTDSIRIDLLENDRKFKALTRSIQKDGILTPLIVNHTEDARFILIDGSRRLAAAKEVGMKEVPIVIYHEDQNKTSLLSIIANAHNKELTLIELGIAYKKLLDSKVYKSNRELADALNVSESTVGTKINNLKLDRRIIEDLIENNTITDQKILKAIRTVEKSNEESVSEKQWEIYFYIKENNLNRKDALEYIKEQKGEVVSQRFVKLESDHQINVIIDTSGLDEESVSRIEELLAEIEELRQGSKL